ncbi:hypothetical protein NCG89_10460 [Spongiibacter taiwanensis]|uniref:Ppx/GppA phosphatase family protein n=1 Tax=Spongiibacter taiwanensis TaxID=1748242 RepID=UPI0020365847|nr:hypothetical protein [Spongiibacter taiwanensis]USA41942.1 hypothetical protein NCG89_10460 [Spongiibacter taiwanensis]
MTSPRVAVVDMGSNSFHLLIAEVQAGRWVPLKTAERKVQLAANRRGRTLCDKAIARALGCLRDYMSLLEAHDCGQLRIVATASLRGTDCDDFLTQVAAVCGVRPDIISGEEEAALVYRGVGARFDDQRHYLVVDIGGGSTEIALGCGQSLSAFCSVSVGCLSYLRYFPDDTLTAAAFHEAYDAAKGEFVAAAQRLGMNRFRGGDLTVVGSSGSLLAVEAVLRRLQLCESGISVAALAWLAEDITRFATLGELEYGGLSEDRRGVFASGVAIVKALFDSLAIEHMVLSQGGLREGVMDRWVSQGDPGL